MTERLKTLAFTVAAIVIAALIFKYIEKKFCKDCKPTAVTPKLTVKPTNVAPSTTSSEAATSRISRG